MTQPTIAVVRFHTTATGTHYDQNAIIRPDLYSHNLGMLYDINLVGNTQRLNRRLDFCSVFIRIHFMRELDPIDLDPDCRQSLGIPCGGSISGLVVVIRQPHSLDFVLDERFKKLIGKTLRSVDERDVFKAVGKERQRIERSLAKNHL